MMYRIRPATATDIPHIVAHRADMFRDMGTAAAFPAMATAFARWLATAMPSGDYRGWLAVTPNGEVVAGAGLVVFAWPPGPTTMDGRCACVFNVYTLPSHRRQGLARRLIEAIHDWSRARDRAQHPERQPRWSSDLQGDGLRRSRPAHDADEFVVDG